jgi:hypothetical protein
LEDWKTHSSDILTFPTEFDSVRLAADNIIIDDGLLNKKDWESSTDMRL